MDSNSIVEYASNLQNLRRCMKADNFRSHFGVDPTGYMMLYGLLGNSNRYDPYPQHLHHKHLLICLDFLKRYETENRMATRYGMTEKTIRKWVWIYTKKIAIQKSKVVSLL